MFFGPLTQPITDIWERIFIAHSLAVTVKNASRPSNQFNDSRFIHAHIVSIVDGIM